MAKKHIKEYAYWREISNEWSINCYTGGVCDLLEKQGHKVQEYELWTIGGGFDLQAGFDEYGAPEILFDVFHIVRQFLKHYNCELIREAIDFAHLKDDLKRRLAKEQLLVWVNSKHMAYSDLYYSNKGYVHAIILNEYSPVTNLARITDKLIVSAPPWSCQADLHFNELYRALHDTVSTTSPLYIDIMGYFYALKDNGNNRKIDDEVINSYLFKMTKKMLSKISAGDSAIIRYSENCLSHIERVNDEEKQWMLMRMNDNIKTLYVLPNRNMLKKVFGHLRVKPLLSRILSEKINDVIMDWTTLANLCLKCSVSKNMKGLSTMPESFEKVRKTEDTLWTTLYQVMEENYET